MVLATIAMITAIVAEIAYRSQVAATVVVNRRDDAKAYQLARAAFRWSLFRLQLDSSLDKIPEIPNTNYGGKKDDLTEIQWAIPLSYPFALGDLNQKDQEITEEIEAQAKQALNEASDIGGSFLSVITDESAKISLNDVGSGGPSGNIRWSAAAEVLENLLLSHRFKPYMKDKDHRELLWAIDDWTDANSEVNHLGGGIEDAEYIVDNASYHIKNGPFYTLSEIRLLKPVSEELFRELKPFVTVYPFNARLPRSSNTYVVPLARININTAPLEVIAALFNRSAMSNLRERLDCAQQFVKARQGIVFRKKKDFYAFLQQSCGASMGQGGTPAIINRSVDNILDVRSDLFSIEATGSAGKIEKTIHAVIWRRNPAKPRILFWKVS